MEPKTLVLDIETAPIEAYTWGLWDQNISLGQIKQEWSILSYAGKWLGKPRMLYNDTSGRGKGKIRDDLHLLGEIWELLDEAEHVVAQNGTSFDIKKINARLSMYGFGPYSPIRVIDTLSAARRHFGFTSNKLEWMSKHLTDSPKSAHKKFPGFELWVECLNDNPSAWKEMKKYNKQDVTATEKLYLHLRPWIASHPNMGVYKLGGTHKCTKCGSSKVQKRGESVTQQGKYQRYHCQACGGWSRGKQMLIDVMSRKKLLA